MRGESISKTYASKDKACRCPAHAGACPQVAAERSHPRASCRVGAALRANQQSLLEGPMCRCERERCVFEWVERVPCRRDRDCWFEPSPRLHPTRRPRQVRQRFKPSEDGEQEPICDAGFCGFGPP
jgi:hypothetical protein